MIGKIAGALWHGIKNHVSNVKLHEFVVMPNHIHGIIEITNVLNNTHVRATHASPLQTPHNNRTGGTCPARTRTKLPTIIGSYKSAVSKHVRRLGYTEFAWHRNYYEHIIRNDRSYQYIADYITSNPTTWDNDKYNRKINDRK